MYGPIGYAVNFHSITLLGSGITSEKQTTRPTAILLLENVFAFAGPAMAVS